MLPFNCCWHWQWKNSAVMQQLWQYDKSCCILTSGLNGGSTSPASSILKLISLKKGCDCTSLPPVLWQPNLWFGFLESSCGSRKQKFKSLHLILTTSFYCLSVLFVNLTFEQRSFTSVTNVSPYSSASRRILLSISEVLGCSPRPRNGGRPAVIS